MDFQTTVAEGIPASLPAAKSIDSAFSHAPKRKDILNSEEKKLALKNALRNFPPKWHEELAKEFAAELDEYGRVYMYRFMPEYDMSARPISEYPAKCEQAAAIMLMIQNNLDPAVAQHPQELITYGGNGSVFQNWAQYLICMQFLAQMNDEQTLVIYSGHPMGLFPSNKNAPRVVVSNGMMIPNYSKPDHWEKYNALGVTQYGQMTAGSFMYIGPQGIVHGTTITILNAARKIDPLAIDLSGKIFVTSGLGGMSGAQPKAAVISNGVCIVAEINKKATIKRHEQGWVDLIINDLDKLIDRAVKAKNDKEAISIAYNGHIVDLWERLVERNIKVDIGSDQTSLHNPWAGGYYPQGMKYEEANNLMVNSPSLFKEKVQETLRSHVNAINTMAKRGMYFFDYGNAFLLEAKRAGADILNESGNFKFQSYVQDIMGPMCFDYGFGPFRWVCSSNQKEDLKATDRIAADVLEKLKINSPDEIKLQMNEISTG